MELFNVQDMLSQIQHTISPATQLQEGFKDIGASLIKYYDEKENGPKEHKSFMSQLAEDICPFIPKLMTEEFEVWIRLGKMMEYIASDDVKLFSTERKVLAERIYSEWQHVKKVIRSNIPTIEQHASFHEIEVDMQKGMKQLLFYVSEQSEFYNMKDNQIEHLLDVIEAREGE